MEDRSIHPLPRIDPKRNATDNTGCPTLCPSPPTRHPEQNETWFALVRRGDCDFVTKAREVQRLGAKALIVGSRDESLLSMSAKGRHITLPHPDTHYNTENFVWRFLPSIIIHSLPCHFCRRPEETTHPTFTYLPHSSREALTSISLTLSRRAILLRMVSKQFPRGWSENLLGNGTRMCLPVITIISTELVPAVIFTSALVRRHPLDQFCPSSSSSPFLPYLPSVHFWSTAHEQPGRHVSNARPRTSFATCPVGCGMAPSGRRTVAPGTV